MLDMGFDQPPRVLAGCVVAAKGFGVEEVERADVERGRDSHMALACEQPFDEVEAGAAEKEAAVDVGGLDVEQTPRVDAAREARDKAHREGRGLSLAAAQHGLVASVQLQTHRFRRAAAPAADNRFPALASF